MRFLLFVFLSQCCQGDPLLPKLDQPDRLSESRRAGSQGLTSTSRLLCSTRFSAHRLEPRIMIFYRVLNNLSYQIPNISSASTSTWLPILHRKSVNLDVKKYKTGKPFAQA